MAKNSGLNLHDILFEQLERLNDLDEEDIKKGKLKDEIARADAMNKVATQMISNGKLQLDAIETISKVKGKIDLPDMYKYIGQKKSLPELGKK